MTEFDGAVAVVTGGGSGIGRAAAQVLHRRGARVVVADVNLVTASAIVTELGEGSVAVPVDVSDTASVEAMTNAAIDAFGRIDILCNNAGFGIPGTVVTTDEATWDRILAVNLKGVYLCSKFAMPHLISTGQGRIVNTSSYTSSVGIRDRAAYVASKGAITALTRAMALDHIADGVRVNAVAPGTVNSPFFTEMIESAPEPDRLLAELNARSPMGRMGTAEEIAEAIAWLASSRSSFATGSVLTVDGGTSAW